MCQYEIIYYHSNHSSLNEIFDDYYQLYEYDPTNLTCYTHLQCNRGPFPACLDWSEICDGQVDCIDDNFDEEYCWQLEINECNDNEYRCTNGQCIPRSFFRDDDNTPDCLDGSDEVLNYARTVKSSMYQCINSVKCISVNCLMNAWHDCPYGDDENLTQIIHANLTELLKNHFKCEITNTYIDQSLVQDGYCDCSFEDEDWCEDEDLNMYYIRNNISFPTICDGFIELTPITIDGKNETDETECEQWSCNNIYTRCDGLWNCLRGEDEIGCDASSTLNCFSNHHKCVSPETNQLICLSIDKANDGKIDCLGATDEPTLCQRNYKTTIDENFYCMKNNQQACISSVMLCNDRIYCDYDDDEQFCVNYRSNVSSSKNIFDSYSCITRSDVEQFLCREVKHKIKQQMKYFSLEGMNKSVKDQTNNLTKSVFLSSSIIEQFHQHERRCHRGFDLRIWLNNEKNLTTYTCLCPPSFYGNMCQYQNQRVSLTIQFRALSDSWSTLFAIVISLIDDSDESIIHSSEQFTYLSIRDCKNKFNIYLLYSTRPKNQTKNYAIHIDIYEKVLLSHRGSFLYPIIFPFLPVYRVTYKVDIPRKNENMKSCSNSPCIHGKCIMYLNNQQNSSFCQCYRGWSGRYCIFPHTSMCSSDSLYIGISALNRSVCICPVNKFGYRCLLTNTICEMDKNLTCQNGGQCIPASAYMISDKNFICICPKGYTGDQCEIVEKKIILSFENDIVLSQSIFIHFIQMINNNPSMTTTTFRIIPFTQQLLTIYWSRPFHLIFIELLNKIYYLAVIEKNYERSTTITKMISSSNRCAHINELFNETFVKMHIIRRIKYYHLPCQNYSSNISCFYDESHICLCYDYGQKRLANCFDFNHNMKFDCLGQSVCENEGKCFQDAPDCPQKSTCICPSCFYGIRCQFSSSRFGLSLDPIIGYHIQPHASLMHQPNIVKITLTLTIIFMIVGFTNGILALITFNNKTICEVGCGLYLLGSSITTLLTTIIFGLKFWILLLAQMALINNRLLLQIQCLSLDFILRACLNIDQWLNACVAMERVITIIKATHFRKEKSRQIAKRVIVILPIIVVSTTIYDPFYRRLIDEENEYDKRIWCIITYPNSIKIFNSIIHTFYFLAPFIINLTSAIMLITKTTHQKSKLQTRQPYHEHLREQIRKYKHLFTAPVVLVILAIPRLVLLFISKCMKSTDDAWLFLVGYFISFIPPMLTLAVFIVPSKFYKKQLRQTLTAYLTNIQRHFEFIK
ncbi:unnamed protein product [Rotaria sp. Silwood2]|nr:unnamed protein product [Rotaria sp. Silwood2]